MRFDTTVMDQERTAFAMTECIQSEFEFAGHDSRRVTAQFDGGQMTTDAGALLLREADRRLNLLPRLAHCFLDGRDPALVKHSVLEMISQRIYGLALGYEDLNDHEQLRQDPLLKVLAGKPDLDQPLAGKSTLNRLELGSGRPDRYKKITYWKQGFDDLLVDVFVEAFAEAPPEIVVESIPPTWNYTAGRRDASSTATMTNTATCRCTFSPASTCWACACAQPTSTPRPEVW